ncbi:MAG TPA: glycosyltransferase [Solirubrobacteraceae bacterium]|jgi:GT2 family glycosyltransferase
MSGATPPPVDVSVLVPVYNEAKVIAETFEAMRDQDYDGTVELLFIDGRSEDDTVAILERVAGDDPLVRILDNPGRTIPLALNIGLAEARGEYVVRMDAHSVYPRGYIRDGIERLRRGDVEWVSGPPVPYGMTPGSRRVALALTSPLGNGGAPKWIPEHGDHDEVELRTTVFAGVWRREVLEAHGGWDEGAAVNEDVELASRFVAAGQRIVCVPSMAARYFPRDSLQGVWRQYHAFGYYRCRTATIHPHSLRRSQLMAPGLVLTGAAAVAPGWLGRLGRTGLIAYAGSVFGATTGSATLGKRDLASGLPAIFVTMHVAWGVGFLRGCLRFGVPFGALDQAVLGRRPPDPPRRIEP